MSVVTRFSRGKRRRILSRAIGPVIAVALRILRVVGRIVPLKLVWLLLWPFAMALAFRGVRRERRIYNLTIMPALAPADRQTTFRRTLDRANVLLTRLLFLWPERLASADFDCCHIEGAHRLDLLKPGQRPVILACLHYGPMTIGGEWLRAHGYPVSAVAMVALDERPSLRRNLGELRDRLGGVGHVPPFIQGDHVMTIRDHLKTNGLLGVAIDGKHGKHSGFPTVGDIGLWMRTGIFRMAEITDARIVPLLVRARPFFGFTLYIGEPVPDELIADRSRHLEAGQHVMRELLPILAICPGQCTDFLLRCLHPADSYTKGRPTPPPTMNSTMAPTRDDEPSLQSTARA